MSPPEPVLIDCPVRERLAKFGRKHASSSETREEMISAASGNAGELLDLLDLGATDVETARAEVVNMSSGKTGVSPPTAAVQNFEAWRRAHRVLLYRVDTFFVFARITHDSLAVLLDQALAPSATKIGKHTGLKKNLPTVAAEHGITVPPQLMKSVDAVTAAIKPFRDNYVVHRAVKNPLASRGVILDSLEPTVRISISQVKRDGTPLGFQTADCGEVYTLILIYTDQVLDLIESPRRS